MKELSMHQKSMKAIIILALLKKQFPDQTTTLVIENMRTIRSQRENKIDSRKKVKLKIMENMKENTEGTMVNNMRRIIEKIIENSMKKITKNNTKKTMERIMGRRQKK